jgi:hypothetical protein
MSDDQLRAAVSKRVGRAIGGSRSTVDARREAALNAYYGRPMGNEIPGRAQVVTKDLMDAIEWIMPSLMRIFTTKQAVQFDPVGPEDEDLAKQESAYVSHVLWKKNNGFMLIYSWLKDALMQRVGYVKYWWEEEEKVHEDEYTGLSQDQLALLEQELAQYGEVEVLEASASHTAPGMPQTWDVRFRVRCKEGRLRLEPVPPDEVLVDDGCKGSVKESKFVGHRRTLMRGELLEMGFSREEATEATSYDWSISDTEQARNVDNERVEGLDEDGVDWATEELELLECTLDIDYDDDGYPEKRLLLVGGHGVMRNEVVDDVQFESWTPIPTPHEHVGLSFHDLLEDLQRIHTALTRGLLDNTYFANNHRLVYDKNTVNSAMLQINRPGGHIANDGPPIGAVVPIPVADIAGRLLPVIAHFDAMRDRRTGVGAMATGVEADVLAQSTKGAYMDASAKANQRIEAIARIFAETGLASLYQSMHKMLSKHQNWAEKFQLKDRWITANPTEWRERANLTVSVGLGTAAKEEVRANLGLMAQAQEKAGQVPGLVQPKNVYALFRRAQTELGFETEDFITDPSSQEYQQWAQSQKPPTDPYVTGKQIDAQTRMQEKQIDSRDKAMDRAQESALKITEMELKTGVDLAKAGIGAEVALARGMGAQGTGGAGTVGQPAAQGIPSGGP